MTVKENLRISLPFAFGVGVSAAALMLVGVITRRDGSALPSGAQFLLVPLICGLLGGYYGLAYGGWFAFRTRRRELIVLRGWWISLLAGLIAPPLTLAAIMMAVIGLEVHDPVSEEFSAFFTMLAIGVCSVVFAEISLFILRRLPNHAVEPTRTLTGASGSP